MADKLFDSPSEHEIQNRILLAMGHLPELIYLLRVNSGKVETKKGGWVQLCPEGTPDLLGALSVNLAAVPLAIEVKRPGERPTLAQHNFLWNLIRRGGIGLWATSAAEALEQLDKVVPLSDGRRAWTTNPPAVMQQMLAR